MKHEVRGQNIINIAVGAAGDKTIQIPVSTTNVWITNLDTHQNVMYANGAAPTFPTDWNRLDPGQGVLFEVPSGVVSLRKIIYYRRSLIGQTVTPSIATTYINPWNATTNTPIIVSGVGTLGDYYVVNTAGNTIIDTIGGWEVGDWIIFNGTTWQKDELPSDPAEIPVTVEVALTDI